jgi:outer membrane protein TolC
LSIPSAPPRWNLAPGFTIAWTQPLVALSYGIESVKNDYAAGKITFEAAKLQLEQNIRKQYLNLLQGKANLKLQQEILDLREQQVTMARANYRNGLSPELTWLQSQVSRDTQKPVVDAARNALNNQMAVLAIALGLPYDTQFELDEVEFDSGDTPLDTKDLIAKAIDAKPELRAARANIITIKHQRMAQALAAWTPSLGISWGMSTYHYFAPFGDYRWAYDQGGLSLSLSWSLNGLLPFTQEGVAISETDDAINTANVQLAQAIHQTESDIYTRVSQIAQARETVKSQEATVKLAQRSYQLTLQAYRAGMQTLLELQTAQNSLSQARFTVLQQQFTVLSDIIDLEYTIGVPFGSLLNKVKE